MIAPMISTGMLSSTDFSGIVAFISGILSFFSPCILPLVPSYLIFISGITFDDYREFQSMKYRKIVLIHSLSFIIGFSFVFIILGISSSALGKLLSNYQVYIMRVGGFILIILGLYYLDVVKIPLLNRERVLHLQEKPVGLLGSFIIGITFSLGWTPCVGPALSSILIIASTTESIWEGIFLLGLYSLGLAIPFLISALIFDQLLGLLKKYSAVVRYSMKFLGVLFVIIGILFFSSYWNLVIAKISQIFAL